jgi:hypothetical protein
VWQSCLGSFLLLLQAEDVHVVGHLLCALAVVRHVPEVTRLQYNQNRTTFGENIVMWGTYATGGTGSEQPSSP